MKKQGAIIVQQIKNGIAMLRVCPFENMDIEPIKGFYDWARLRIGKYKILFSTDLVHKIVTIEEIGTRGDIPYRTLGKRNIMILFQSKR